MPRSLAMRWLTPTPAPQAAAAARPLALSTWWQQAALVFAFHASVLLFEVIRTNSAKNWDDALHFTATISEWLARQLIHVAFAVVVLQLIGRSARPRPWRTPLAFAGMAVAAVAGAATSIFVLPFEPAPVRMGSAASNLVLFWYVLWINALVGLIALGAVDSLRHREQAARRLADAQEQGRLVREELAAAQLLAIQARVDPQLLFDVLATVRRLYESDAARAEQLLDDLTEFLRAALPRLRSANSQLGVEFGLVQRYAGLKRDAGAGAMEVRALCPAEVAQARFPAGVLLPLLSGAMDGPPAAAPREEPSGRDARVVLAAVRRADALCVRLEVGRAPAAEQVQRIGASLAAMHGPRARLEVLPAIGGWRVDLEVPFEHA